MARSDLYAVLAGGRERCRGDERALGGRRLTFTECPRVTLTTAEGGPDHAFSFNNSWCIESDMHSSASGASRAWRSSRESWDATGERRN
jgi:hypothetical protein